MLKLLKLTPRKIQPFQPLYEDALRQVRELKTEIEGLKAVQIVDEILCEEAEKQAQKFKLALERIHKIGKEGCAPDPKKWSTTLDAVTEIATGVLKEKQFVIKLKK